MTRFRPGTSSRKISNRFGASSTSSEAIPVRLPPGRAKLFQSQFHGIAPTDEDDRDAIGRHLRGSRGIAAFGRHDDVRPAPDELPGGRQKLGALALREAHADREVLVLAVPERPQAIPQSNNGWRRAPGLGQRADLDP